MMLLALASRRLPTLSPKLLYLCAEVRLTQQLLARIPPGFPVQVQGIPVTKHRRATLYLKSHRLRLHSLRRALSQPSKWRVSQNCSSPSRPFPRQSQACHPALCPIHFVVTAAHSFWMPPVRQKHPR